VDATSNAGPATSRHGRANSASFYRMAPVWPHIYKQVMMLGTPTAQRSAVADHHTISFYAIGSRLALSLAGAQLRLLCRPLRSRLLPARSTSARHCWGRHSRKAPRSPQWRRYTTTARVALPSHADSFAGVFRMWTGADLRHCPRHSTAGRSAAQNL
jgi:hypothetical protein